MSIMHVVKEEKDVKIKLLDKIKSLKVSIALVSD